MPKDIKKSAKIHSPPQNRLVTEEEIAQPGSTFSQIPWILQWPWLVFLNEMLVQIMFATSKS